jgi:hypothetical protein
VLSATIAGALAALLVVWLVVTVRGGGHEAMRRLLLPAATAAIGGLLVLAVLDRLVQDERGAERRALEQRQTALATQALAPGSALGCLDDEAGETVENACEQAVFAGPQSTAGAVAYMAARINLLQDALGFARRADPSFAARFAGLRRAIELDRFGIAAHVLAMREGCTAAHCAAFALLQDANAIKANLKAQAFDQYVSRYAAAWTKAPAEKQPNVAVGPMALAPREAAEPSGHPVSDKYDFPSADSIPAVNIMTPEPPLPKSAAADASAKPAPAERKRPPPKRAPSEPAPPLVLH